jgi:hypothetical protein
MVSFACVHLRSFYSDRCGDAGWHERMRFRQTVTLTPEIGRSTLPLPPNGHLAQAIPSTRSCMIGPLVAVDVGRCLAKRREVISAGIQLGVDSRIVCGMLVSNLARFFVVTAGGHRCVSHHHEPRSPPAADRSQPSRQHDRTGNHSPTRTRSGQPAVDTSGTLPVPSAQRHRLGEKESPALRQARKDLHNPLFGGWGC